MHHTITVFNFYKVTEHGFTDLTVEVTSMHPLSLGTCNTGRPYCSIPLKIIHRPSIARKKTS